MPSEKFMQHHYGASGYIDRSQASEECPVYRKVEEGRNSATPIFMIVCDEGWRESIVCTGMYEWAADWLLTIIQRKPYAKASVHINAIAR